MLKINEAKKILVTGGAGFIGSHLVRDFLSEGYSVTVLDNLLTGSKRNIEDLVNLSNFDFVEGDVCDSEKVMSLNAFNYVFHLASPASPIDYQEHPEETLLVNSQGTLNLLSKAKKDNAKFLLASTSEIYGDPLEHPQKESYWGNANSFGPRACYDESKRFAEASLYVYLKKHDLDARVIRIFNTYGPHMQKDDGRVVSNFINWAIKNEEIKIDGDGSQTRSFCFVSDLVDGIKKAMLNDKTKGEIFNLGNPDEFTIKELADEVIELTGSQSKIVCNGSFRTDDPMKRRPDISKAKDLLNWIPKVNLKEGLKKTIEYYKQT